MKASTIEAFHKVIKIFKRWKQEILQSSMYPFNNGYVESVNNTMKVAKRMCYGIKDFDGEEGNLKRISKNKAGNKLLKRSGSG